MRHSHGVDSEVGRLRSVLVHRPGAELKRITPRVTDRLLFGGLPWVDRARQEHDILTQALRDHGVEVLYVSELLQDTMEYQPAREEAIASVLGDTGLGEALRSDLRRHLEGLDPEELAGVLVAGLTAEEFRGGRGLVYGLLDRRDFVVGPLPNLVFTSDSSAWIGGAAAVASLAGGFRRRESALIGILYRRHPRFAGTECVYDDGLEHLDGGDVLTLAPGVIATGISARTTPAGAERLAARVLRRGLARTVLAVPLPPGDPHTRLDTICTVIDVGTVVMLPSLAYTLRAHTVTLGPDGLRVSRAQPFLEAATRAMEVDTVTLIGTGLDPQTASRQQWDDGGNALAIAPGVLVCHERNAETNARLEAAGIEVIRVPASELGTARGGPRCMSRALCRDRVAAPVTDDTGPPQATALDSAPVTDRRSALLTAAHPTPA